MATCVGMAVLVYILRCTWCDPSSFGGTSLFVDGKCTDVDQEVGVCSGEPKRGSTTKKSIHMASMSDKVNSVGCTWG